MSSASSANFLSGLQLYFITKKLGKVQRQLLVEKTAAFGGKISTYLNENTTHVLFPRGVDYEAGLKFLKLTSLPGTPEAISAVSIDWLPECIAVRKLIPETQFRVKRSLADSLGVHTNVKGYLAAGGACVVQTPRKIHFTLSGTSTFCAAKEMVGATGIQVLIRKTLAYHNKYGMGIFCLTKNGEQQIGWVPESSDRGIFDVVGKMCLLPNFKARIDKAVSKTVADQYTKITISIICETSE